MQTANTHSADALDVVIAELTPEEIENLPLSSLSA